MNGKQAKEIATFGIALARMAAASKTSSGIELSADENKAIVNVISILSRGKA